MNCAEREDSASVNGDALYKTLFDKNPFPVWIYDVDTLRFLKVNDAAVKAYGYSAAEFLDLTILDIRPSEDNEKILRFLASQPRDFTNHTLWRHQTRDGRIIWVELHSYAFIWKERNCRMVTVHDVTERERIEQSLAESELRFRAVAEATTDVLWDLDIIANRIWWGAGAERVLGYTPEDLGNTLEFWEQNLHPEDRARIIKSLKAAIEGCDTYWKQQYRFRRKDGIYAIIRDQGKIIRNRDGIGIRMVGGLCDLTEIKRLEEQVASAQRIETLATLASGIAHDLNNLLAPIMMSVGLLKMKSTDPSVLRILKTLEVSARRGTDLIRQILALSRTPSVELKCFNPLEVVLEVEHILNEILQEGIELEVCLDAETPSVMGDETQLHQVLFNLCLNARDAMPEGGKLSIKVGPATIDEEQALLHPSATVGDYICMSVSDTGTGIPASIIDRIWDPFFTTKAPGKGTGFGLPGVQTIIEKHKGFILLDTTEGVGTTFQVYIPVADKSESPLNRERQALVSTTASRNILLVDDEPEILEILHEMLSLAGHTVEVANNSATAVDIFRQNPERFDLVLADLMISEKSGKELVPVLRQISTKPPIIGMSGLAKSHGSEMPADVISVIHKPFTSDELLDAVQQAGEIRGSAL